MHPMTTPPIPTIRPFPILIRAFVLMGLSLCLVGFQPPPPDGTGSGSVQVQVVSTMGMPVGGVRVRYVDEWHRHPYGVCTTTVQGACLITIEHAPTLGVMLRGVLEVEGSDRVQDAMLMVGEQVTVSVMLDSSGTVSVEADVLATRDPNATPTLIGIEDALATLTAAASEPLATPSVGIELTVAVAHRAMTATSVARASLTPTPRFTPTTSTTPSIGVALVVNNTPIPFPEASAPSGVSTGGLTPADLSYLALQTLAALVVGTLLAGGGAWWVRRRRGGDQ